MNKSLNGTNVDKVDIEYFTQKNHEMLSIISLLCRSMFFCFIIIFSSLFFMRFMCWNFRLDDPPYIFILIIILYF